MKDVQLMHDHRAGI
ncbi:hypothetical protein RSAG8_01421, partial [Rhizoctonia solani AG-8 WAC10335]